MSQLNRRFDIAHDRARADWAAADPVRCAERSGCLCGPDGITVRYFGRDHRITHPAGDVTVLATGKTVHPSVTIVLLHYLLTADGSPVCSEQVSPTERWLNFRQLPDGLFYAKAFANHAEDLLATRFGADVSGFRSACEALGGKPPALAPGGGLAPPDAAYQFQAFPRLAVAVQLWEGDDEFPGRAQVLFEAQAGHYLPTEDLSGVGDGLAHKLSQT